MNVRISSDAEFDIIEGYEFYERQSPGLGGYFRDSLLHDIDELRDVAGMHERVYGYHRALSRKFPFAIYYEVSDDTALVVAVVDCRRNPAWIRRRVES